jgi:carboxymethylenebutenolidase
VVVIHEAFGLNADIRGHADRLAALGYLALAPDLYEGRSWLRCIRGMIRQLHAGSGPAFDALDACRGWLGRTSQSIPGESGLTGARDFRSGPA